MGIHPNDAATKSSVELVKAVVDLRNYKSKEEVSEIEKAVDISVDMHVAAMKLARPGMKEAELAAAVQQVAVAAGGQISFPIII